MFYKWLLLYYHYFSSSRKEIMKLLWLYLKPWNILLARLWSCSFDTLNWIISWNLWYTKVRSNKLETSRFQAPMCTTAPKIPSYTLIIFNYRSSNVKLDIIISVCSSSTWLRSLLLWLKGLLLVSSTVLDLNIDGLIIAHLFNCSLRTIIYLNRLCRLLILDINKIITKNS